MRYERVLRIFLIPFAFVALIAAGAQEAGSDPSAEGLGEPDRIIELFADGLVFFDSEGGERNPELVVKQGEVVLVKLEVRRGFHDWVVQDLDVATSQVGAGNSTQVQFLADQVGEFEYICSVPGHRAGGMFGTLIVEAADAGSDGEDGRQGS